ncbi:MAG: hypothetical protein KA290_13595, partial [Chitinophagaceae bacterium]|nr:hypothetical protein [Chitinophagaceae bacterium]
MKRIYFLVMMMFVVSISWGQVSINAGSTPYSENFDALTTTNFNLTNNTSITGVYAFRTLVNATPNVFTADNGASNTGRFNNYGTTSATDRALGSASSAGPGTLYYGVKYVNNTGSAITSLSVTYTGEQWRNGGNATAQILAFDYRQASSITDLTTGTYTAVAALNFTTPTNSAIAAALDGNNSANRAVLTNSITVNIPAGEEIMLRWTDINDAGVDHGVAIDDLSVTATLASCSAPSTQASAITFSSVGINTMTVGWTNGDGLARIVVMNTTNSFTDPIDGTTPLPDPNYSGSGEQVVYNGNGNSVDIAVLSPATTYWYRVYEYNCIALNTKYNITTAANNPNNQVTLASCAAPLTQASLINFTAVGGTVMTINWTPGNGSKRIVIINTTNSFTNPVDGVDPSANTAYSGSGEQVIYNNTGSSVSVTGLSYGTTYWYRVYEYNCSGVN